MADTLIELLLRTDTLLAAVLVLYLLFQTWINSDEDDF